MARILYIVIGILFVFWLVGFILHFGGWLIHIALLVCGVLFVIQLVTGRKIV